LAYDPTTGLERVLLVEADPAPLATPDPAQTYRLAHFRFDHSGACAGEDQKVAIAVGLAHWLDAAQGNEVAWNVAALGGIGWNQPAILGTCGMSPDPPSLLSQLKPARRVESALAECDQSVPTRATSWGSLKSTYR